jgi:flagella basal body P-ring formation protein FlgA
VTPRIAFGLLALLLVLPARADGAESALTVVLREEIEVPAGEPVRIDALASVEGAAASRAAQLVVDHAPAAGRVRVVTRAAVERVLAAGDFAGGAAVTGAVQVRVRGAGQSLARERVEAALAAAIGAAVPDARVRLVDLAVPAIELPAGPYQLHVALGRRGPAAGLQRFTVEARGGEGSWTRRVLVRARVELVGPVLVAARDLAPGERIGPADVRVEDRTRRSPAPVLTAAEAVVGAQVRSAVRADEPVPARAVEHGVAVEPGQLVVALLRAGAVQLTLETTARSRGRVGETVQVAGVGGRGLVEARVVAPGRVVVLGSEEIER